MPSTPSGLAPKLDDMMQRHENARAAIHNARKLLPGWQATARMLSRKKDLKIKLVANDVSKTDGQTILIKVPYELANLPEHDRSLCGKRGEYDLLKCTACDVLEDVNITVIHEVCHVVFDTFAGMTEYERSRIVQTAIDLHAEGTPSEARLRQIKKKLQQLQEAGIKDYFTISNTVSPYFPIIINALEDIRVNSRMQEHRPGTKVMFNSQTAKIFREGIKDYNGKPMTWATAPVNAQAIIGLYCKAGGFDYEHALDPDVVARIDDETLDDLCAKTIESKSIHQVYRLAVPLLERLRQLGFCLDPDDPEDPLQEPDPDKEQEDDDSDSEDADSRESQGDRQAERGSDSDQEEQDSDDPSAGDMDSGDSGDDSPEADAGEESSEGEDSGPGDEGSDSDGEEEESDSHESDSGDDSGDEGDSDGEADSEGTGGSSGSGDAGLDEGEPDSGDSENGGSRSDNGGVDGIDENNQKGDRDSTDSGDSPGEDSSEGEGSESDNQDSGGGNEESDLESDNFDDGDKESSLEGEDSDPDNLDSSEQEASNQSKSDNSSDSGTDSDEGTDDPVSSEVDEGGSDTGDGEGTEKSSEQLDPAEGDSDNGDQSTTTPDTDPSTGSNEDFSPDDTGQSENDPEMSDKDSQDQYSQADQERDGTPSDIEHLFAIFGRHEKQEPSPSEAIEEQVDEEVLETALEQVDFFDAPSLNIGGVKEYKFTDSEGAWANRRHRNTSPVPVTEGMLVSALQRLRLVFTDNARGRTERNRRTGKVDGRVLAKRAPQGDDRLFKKRTVPGRKDYFVVLGMDCSGSTARYIEGGNIMLDMIKAAAGAKAELLSRLGIPFAMYAHSGDWENVAIFEIKKATDRWGVAQKEALENLNPYSGNIDGHTLEYYRKVAERRPETDKLILYYTDGAMPASNYNEELEILQREIKTCERLGIHLVGVGVQSDAPLEHGLDTILLDEIGDIPKVVDELRKRLM